MRMKGDRVHLRAAEPKDADQIFKWENNPDHWLISNTVAPYSMDQILNFIEHENDIYLAQQLRLMIDGPDGSVGCIDLYDFDPKNHRVGVGILIDEVYRGGGYGKEALKILVDYCFQTLDVHSMYAEVLSSNTSSLQLFESVGFEQTGIRKEWLWDGADYSDQLFLQKFSEA